jgi:hypothetical protein
MDCILIMRGNRFIDFRYDVVLSVCVCVCLCVCINLLLFWLEKSGCYIIKGGYKCKERERERVTHALPQNLTSCMQQTLSLFPKEKTLNPAACIPLEP